jgi:hypothetical protein
VLDLNGASAGTDYTALFTENGPAVAIAGTAVLITDDDDVSMERATITLANPQANDRLTVNLAGLPATISVDPTSTDTTIILIGSASKSDYETALQQVQFENTSDLPGSTDRVINVVVNDGPAPSNTAVTTISIDRAPDAADDFATTQADTPIGIVDVLANDDEGDGPATIAAYDTVSAQGGSVINNGDGTFAYTPLAGFTGTDTFHYTIGDQDGDESTAEVSITVTDGAPIILERSVISGLDDVEERSTGSVSTNSSDLELVDDRNNTDRTIGIRFTGIDIPQGAIITAAYIQFQVDEVSTGAATLTIRGEDSDDAAAFTNNKLDVSSRTMTDASANWLPADWVARGEAGLDQRTSDLTAIIQEIIDREGWAALNDMVFTITGSGTRTAEAFEGDADGAPMLHVEYVLPDTGTCARSQWSKCRNGLYGPLHREWTCRSDRWHCGPDHR